VFLKETIMKVNKHWVVGLLFCAGTMFAAPICPTTSSDMTGADATGCGVLINYTGAGGTVTLTGTGAYDGSEDETVGLMNNSGKALTSLTLSSTSGAFGFDGDGIQSYSSTNGVPIPTGGATGYEGPNMTFTVAGSGTTMTINFTTALGIGGTTYFSLEGPPSLGFSVGANSPEPASMAMLASGILALGTLGLRRRRKQ
jgi:hypothetical protein